MSSDSTKSTTEAVDSSGKHLTESFELIRERGLEVDRKLELGNCRTHMFPVLSEAREKKSGSVVGRQRRKRTPPDVKVLPHSQGPAGDALDFFCAELGDNRPPLANRSGADIQRPRDIRGALKVIENFAFKHGTDSTTVELPMQARFRTRGLTLVHMTELDTLAKRLVVAMRDENVSKSELARACGVSATAVGKWVTGDTKVLEADNYEKAARRLKVTVHWLKDAKSPRKPGAPTSDEQYEQLVELLQRLAGPIASLNAVIEEVVKSAPQKKKPDRA